MKPTPVIAAIACLVLLSMSCTKDAGSPAAAQPMGNLCNYSPVFNADFARINGNSSYNDLFKIFLSEGDNFRTDVTNIDSIVYYRWYPCTDKAHYYIECQLEGGELLLAQKTFSDTSCAANVSVAGYDSLAEGMSFTQVQATLKGRGDNYRNEYNLPGNHLKAAWYRFTDCSDTATHIEVKISPVTGLALATKSF